MDVCMFMNVYHIAWILPWIIIHTSAQPNMITLSVPSGTEGSQLTLTCQTSEDVDTFGWYRTSVGTTYHQYLGAIWNSWFNQPCVRTNAYLQPNSTLYIYSCLNISTHTLTLMNVTSRNHGEIWQCTVWPRSGGIIYSNNVTISVQVAVTRVALSPSTEVTTVNVSQPTTFECTVPRSLPSAAIVWYKNSSGVISYLTHFSSVSSTPNSDGTVRTISRLIFTPNATDHGVILYCTASSGEAGMTSEQTLLNVQFPVTSVELSPPTDVATVNMSQPATFKCTVPRSLPSATIVWHKNSSGLISNPIPSSSSNYYHNSHGTVTTTGILIFSPSKEDNGVGLYCTASSGGASRTSRQILFNVQSNTVEPGETFSVDQGHKQIQTHNIGVLVGSVIGSCVIGIALGIVGTWLLLHRRNKKTSESAHHYEIANGPRNEGEYATVQNTEGNHQANTEYHRYDNVASCSTPQDP